MRLSLLCALCLFLLPATIHAQGATPVGTGSGSILLTVTAATDLPASGITATFEAEGGQTFGSCTTDRGGRCTISVQSAPTGASGLFRGAVVIEGRGRRPVTWPSGESLDLTIQLDESGQIGVPADLFPTRTPNPAPPVIASQTAAAASSSVPIDTEAVEVTSTTSAIPSASAQIDSTAPATASAPSATGKSGEQGSALAVGIALVVGVIFILVAFYLLLGRKESA